MRISFESALIRANKVYTCKTFFLYLEEQEESEDNDDQNEAESHDQEADQSEPEPLPVLSSIELYALRQKKLAERKSKIANLAQEITENPEQNVIIFTTNFF